MSSTFASLDEWISCEGRPFPLEGPAFASGVRALANSLHPETRLLGLGEALHSSEELLQYRNAIFRVLVEDHGFSAFAIESSFTRASRVDEYIRGVSSLSYEDVRADGFSHGFFAESAANHELIEWMRGYNSAVSAEDRLHFYGFDIPGTSGGPASPRETLEALIGWASQVSPSKATLWLERAEQHLGADSQWENPMIWQDSEGSQSLRHSLDALRLLVEDIAMEMSTLLPERRKLSGARSVREASHAATLASRYLQFFAALGSGSGYAPCLAVRDYIMAENLFHIANREEGRGRTFIFAHNTHLQKGKAKMQIGSQTCEWWPAGAHLAERLGSRYTCVAHSVLAGEEHGITEPEPGTLEEKLMLRGGPLLLPTCGGRYIESADFQDLALRGAASLNPTYAGLSAQSLADFDWWLTLPLASKQRNYSPLPE